MNKRGYLAQLIGAFVVILIGVSLVPTVAKQVSDATANMTSSQLENMGASKAFLDLAPVAFAIAILLAAIAVAWSALKPFVSSDDEDEEDSEDEDSEDEEEDEDYEDEIKEPTPTVHKQKEKYKRTEEVVDEAPTKPINEKELNKKYKQLERSKFD